MTKYEILFVNLLLLIFIFVAGKTRIRKEEINKSIYLLDHKLVNKRKEYKIKESILKRLNKNKFDNMALTALAHDMLKHTGVNPAALYVTTDRLENKAGQYQINGNQSTITINTDDNYSIEDITGIIAHECMHFYLRARGLKFENVIQNEILTDVATLYTGFDNYTYISRDKCIGYLNKAEIRYALEQIRKCQSNH